MFRGEEASRPRTEEGSVHHLLPLPFAELRRDQVVGHFTSRVLYRDRRVLLFVLHSRSHFPWLQFDWSTSFGVRRESKAPHPQKGLHRVDTAMREKTFAFLQAGFTYSQATSESCPC